METYHKIQTLFKRHLDGPKKGKLIVGDWARPEIGYLADLQWEFTEKVDGTNIRINMRRITDDVVSVTYGGRTDNAVIPKVLLENLEATFPTKSTWRRDLGMPAYTTRHKEIVKWMQDNDLENVTLYGEGYGPKIQNGGNYRKDHAFVLFDVKINDFWLDRANVDDVAKNLGIDSVPTIGYGTLQDAVDIVTSGITFNKQGAVERWGSGGLKSQWGDFEAEGIVARPLQPLFNRKGERIIVKIKGVDFK